MKIYQNYRREHTVYIQPGAHHKGCSDFMNAEGKPHNIPVKFINGVAEVEDPIGRYMVDMKMARDTRFDPNVGILKKTSDCAINCPDCGTLQPEPSEETRFICSNFQCRRDFIRDPIAAGLGELQTQIHPFNMLPQQ